MIVNLLVSSPFIHSFICKVSDAIKNPITYPSPNEIDRTTLQGYENDHKGSSQQWHWARLADHFSIGSEPSRIHLDTRSYHMTLHDQSGNRNWNKVLTQGRSVILSIYPSSHQ
jgi:hypothetical protein